MRTWQESQRESGRLPASEELDEPTRAFEAVALGLRRIDGLSRAAFAVEFGTDPLERFADAVGDATARGLLEVEGQALRLSAAGRLFANEVLVGFAPVAASPR